MKVYLATGNGTFETKEEAVSSDPSLVKLKIDTVFPTVTDVAVFQGKLDVEYPVCPCHMATAIVSEDRPEYGLRRGAKVMLNPYIQKSGEDYSEPEVFGIKKDGFLRDFAAVPIENIVPFPEGVKEEDAVFAEIIAVALSVINTLKPKKGEYIAILGGSLLNNAIAQLALYYQAIPIVVSADKRYQGLAERSGVYYVIDENEEDVLRQVTDITGGRLAEYSVLHATANANPQFAFSLVGNGGTALLASLTRAYIPRIETDISRIAKKGLKFAGVSDGYNEFNAAVNMLANKRLSFGGYIDKKTDLEGAPALFRDMANDPTMYVCPIIKV